MALNDLPLGIHLYWIPLGADGSGFVRFNGRVYEALLARRERRLPLDLYHTALVVGLSEGQYVVETGTVELPFGGRAPGWRAGIVVAGSPVVTAI